MSSDKTDVNPSDIGTKALGRERFYRLRSMLCMGTELSETSSPGKWYSGDQPDTIDMTVTYFSAHRRLELKSDRIENNSHPCAQRTLHPFCVVSLSCMVAEQVFLELGY